MHNKLTKPGIDNLIENKISLLHNKRIALITNLASINYKNIPTSYLLYEIIRDNLKAILVPEHGLYCFKEYMVKVESDSEPLLKIPIYSLYGDHIAPPNELFHLQDVGVRYYTYSSTLTLCMEKCSILKKELIVLDRPNPLSGNIVQGNILEKKFQSFVGMLQIPIRHGLTIGELALLIKDYFNYDLPLTVIPMINWERNMFWDDTNLFWIQPSPNMPRWETTIYYPGCCLLEGTNISEGRGTTKPFEIIGAPWLNPFELASFLNELNLPYISAIPIFYIPKSDKYQNEKCAGIQLCITNPSADSYTAMLKIIHFIYKKYKKYFNWRLPPYEFNNTILPFDLLNGTDTIRKLIEKDENIDDSLQLMQNKISSYYKIKEKYHLY